jgi:hypothetical protein
MSVASTDAQKACCEECEDRTALPDTTPHQPVVVFASAESVARGAQAVRVYLDESPSFFDDEDELYDARGIQLTRVTAADGTTTLEARGEAHPAEVQQRVMAVLRTVVAQQTIAPGDAAEVETVLQWLDAAPDLPSLLRACGVGDGAMFISTGCISGCSPWTKIWNKRCCKT